MGRGVVYVRRGLARSKREEEKAGHTKLDDHLAPWDIAFPELETIGDSAPSTELDGLAVGRAGVLVLRAGIGYAADGDGEEGVGVGECGRVVAEELSGRGSAGGRERGRGTYRGPAPEFLATKLSVMDFTLGERGRRAAALRRAANVLDTGAGIFFCCSEGNGRGKQRKEIGRKYWQAGHVGEQESGDVITCVAC